MQKLLITAILLSAASWLLTGCTIEPPLHLADENDGTDVMTPIVITDLDVVWDVAADWRTGWYYGWDAIDESRYGKLEYPVPTNFEVRRYYYGLERADDYLQHDGFTVYGTTFRRHYQYGYHNMLIWSNIDSDDGTQSVIIDERDPSNIVATTSRTRVGYQPAGMTRTRVVSTHNQPDIFYAAYERDIYISDRIEDYDYYDEAEHVWVKRIRTELSPMVYIYLVQVVLHNNNGRVYGLADVATMSGLADGVNLHTGETSQVDANITFDMRMKTGIDVEGETCDVLGGMLTTYGLCGMPPWMMPRSAPQEATRLDVFNELSVCLLYDNDMEGVATFVVTDQFRKQVHGGVITVHVDVDDLDIPEVLSYGSGFIPTVEDYRDEEDYEFSL